MTTVVPNSDDPFEFDPTLVLLDVKEAARRLGLGRTTVYALIASGELKSVMVGRLRRVTIPALHAYAEYLSQSQHARTAA